MKPIRLNDNIQRVLITPGEPAGIGPDITIQMAQNNHLAELVVIADPDLLRERAKQLNLPLQLIECDLQKAPIQHKPHTLKILPIKLQATVTPQQLNPENAAYVIATLKMAADICLEKTSSKHCHRPRTKKYYQSSRHCFFRSY